MCQIGIVDWLSYTIDTQSKSTPNHTITHTFIYTHEKNEITLVNTLKLGTFTQ